MSVLGAAAIGAGASLLTGLLSSSSASSSNKLTQEENQKNRDWQEYMWNQYNEYNLPVNQVARLQQAGLNPALMYGTGGSTDSGSASSMAGAPSTNNQFQQTFSPQTMQSIAQLVNAGLQTSLTKSQVDKNYSEIGKSISEIKNIDLDSAQKRELLKSLSERYQLEIDSLAKNNNLIDAMTQQTLTGEMKMQYEINNIRSLTDKTYAEINNLHLDSNYKVSMQEQLDLLNEWYPKLQASIIALQTSEGKNYDAQKMFYESSRQLNLVNKRSVEIENSLRSRYGSASEQYKIWADYAKAAASISSQDYVEIGKLGKFKFSHVNNVKDLWKSMKPF